MAVLGGACWVLGASLGCCFAERSYVALTLRRLDDSAARCIAIHGKTHRPIRRATYRPTDRQELGKVQGVGSESVWSVDNRTPISPPP